MSFDISSTIEPRSDQQNFDDYLLGPRLVTISAVSKGNAEQPVNIELAEYPGRPFKPNKSMRRILVKAWGAQTAAYVGRRLELVGNPAVMYGGKAVGGIEIAKMSHIEKPLKVALTVSRGKKALHRVEPLILGPTPEQVAASSSIDELRGLYQQASPDVQALILARVEDLKAADETPA